jgi:hypothetical protein
VVSDVGPSVNNLDAIVFMTVVPEASTCALFGAGFVLLGAWCVCDQICPRVQVVQIYVHSVKRAVGIESHCTNAFWRKRDPDPRGYLAVFMFLFIQH